MIYLLRKWMCRLEGGILKRRLNPDCREGEGQITFIVIHLMPVLLECSGTTAAAKGMQLPATAEGANRCYIYPHIAL